MIETIGGYEILRELGRGGMGVVLEGRDPASGRRVAIKLLNPEGVKSEKALERFRREAQALARLRHPYVVQIHSFGTHSGQPYFVQDFVEGRPLDEVYGLQAPLSEVWVAGLIAKVAAAVQVAHEAGILHRDLKPVNVVCRPSGDPVLLDFGIVRSLGETQEQRLSRTGAGVGTPGYWSPEQACGERDRLGPASDVYSLGGVLYYLLVGKAPIDSYDGLQANIMLTVAEPPTRPSVFRPKLSPDLERICMRCLEKEPEDRYESAADLARDLEAFRRRKPVRGRRPRRWGLGVLFVLVAAVAAVGGLAAGRGAGKQEPGPPPDLRVAAIDTTTPCFRSTVRIEGEAQASGDWVEVGATGVAPQRVRAGRFALEVPLAADGENVITVSARTSQGASVTTRVVVNRYLTPGWFADLAPEARPWPLPEQLRVGEIEGEYVNQVDESVLVYIPPTRFRMGREPEPDKERRWVRELRNDEPAHWVTLSGYFLGKYEVTWAQFEAFVQAVDRPRLLEAMRSVGEVPSAPELPVWGLHWGEARAYCQWANLRLPTEAEWELGARGRNRESRFPWGERDPIPGDANFPGGEDGAETPVRGGSFPSDQSEWGCFDMAGNLSEWVSDCFSPYEGTDQIDPRGGAYAMWFDASEGWKPVPPGREPLRVLRGGSWDRPPKFAPVDPYVANPNYYESTRRWAGIRTYLRVAQELIGFRVCLSHEAAQK